ncbi:MAG: chromosome segregation protein SMC [Candidatus Eisenbacteria sp.]|nr:chromosome segregation protein SMC [Candidatus Eisenbacteria bacterium]
MHLKKVEICGFKSFPEKLEIEFGPGITAVVGPNGCGKTNLSDAIRWVLGEQSAKQLRGKTMEDVIFNGSEMRKPLGMAEVSLTVGGCANLLPVPYDEVCVTRRVFRSGESEYFLNRKPCRLKDIRDLFLDTGIGANAYSIMERDMIDEVLDERSGARRGFIEEVAGITKYKDREVGARRKLELTDQDLVRLKDVIQELEKRVRSLEYQMGKARRYNRLTERLRVMEAARARAEVRAIAARSAEAEEDMVRLRDRREASEAGLSEIEAHLENLSLRRMEHERRLAQAQETLTEAERQAETVEAETLVLRERLKGARALLVRAAEEKSALEQQFNRVQSEREDASLTLVTLEGRRSARREEHRTLEAEVADLEKQLAAWKTLLSEKRDHALKVFENRVRSSNELGTLGKNLERLLEEKTCILQQVSELGARMDEMEQDLSSLDEATLQLDNEIGGLEARRQRLGEGSRKHLERLSNISSRSVSLESKMGALQEKLGLLKGLEESLEGYESGVKTVLAEKKTQVCGVVAELVSVREPRYETAVEAALSSSLQLIVTQELQTARGLVEYLRAGCGGVAGFLAVEGLEGIEADGVPADICSSPGVIGKASEFVVCDQGIRPVVDYLLGRTVLTETLDTAVDLSLDSRCRNVTFVTLDGDAVAMPGRFSGGRRSEGDLSIVGRKGEIGKTELEMSEIQALLGEIREFEQKALKVRERLARISQLVTVALEEKRGALSGQQQWKGELNVEMAQCGQSRQMLAGQLDRMETEIRQIDMERNHVAEDVTLLTGEESEAGNLTTALEQKVQTRETTYRNQMARLSALRTELVALDGEEMRLRSRAGDLAEQAENLGAQIRQRVQEISGAEVGIREYEESLVQMAADLRIVSGKVDSSLVARDRLREGGGGFREEEVSFKQRLKDQGAERDRLGEQIHQLDMDITRMEAAEKSVVDQIREKYEADLDEFEIPEDIGEIGSGDIENVRRKIKALGPVNLIALEEYEQEKERLDFLNAQKQDLGEAKESLEQAIVQIHQTARKRFSEGFAQVREKFTETFATLFKDGEADLRLEDPSDPLHSGIAIVARPKGKLERHISLLSGGERSLTAIAFLVALYLVKPSAFCFLDEIDAALDDANVLKFANLLKGLKKKTQFVMITHNKRSMEVASCLYGVTMSEPGVSRIVSVDLTNHAT